ncbi:MAG: AbrB/MazE/SpoVT family DNA-binding domain-containing protein [Oscillospiraceae bacterium]|nr:AbrB/MazE/SpoVT family DNA-binding domain-containing protein [Oscillospiraceae bacterium]
MENTGIFRRVDGLGRFVLPKELRKTLNINQNDCLQIFLEGDSVVLRKTEQKCAICNKKETENETFLTVDDNKKICKECLQKIKSL